MTTPPLLRRAAFAASPLLALTAVVGVAAPARAVSTSVVISEVFGGGGNSGAAWRNDYVELFNTSGQAIDLTGWQVQYWSAAKPAGSPASSHTTLTGTVAPGAHFLVQEGGGVNESAAPLPTPDSAGTIAMSGSGAQVAILDPSGSVIDRLGWGDAVVAESSPAPATTNATSSTRTQPCFDTDRNAIDFASLAPTPENSATAAPIDCSKQTPPPDSVVATITEIQGESHLSPLLGKAVSDVNGIVVATDRAGFWMESAKPDATDATSEGLYVYTKSTPSVLTGDAVSVDGAVSEFRAGGPSGHDNTTTTQLVGPTITTKSAGNPLPAPVVIGVDRIAPQQTIEAGDPGSVESKAAQFRPTIDAIDFYESLEGMRVAVRDAQVVGPTKSFGEIPVVPGQNVDATRSPRGGVVYGGYDQPNAMRVQLDDGLLPRGAMPQADVGDHFAGDTVGVMGYSFSNYKLEVTTLPTLVAGGLKRQVTTAQTHNQLAVATFNVENLAPSNPQTKYDRLAGQVVHNLQSPDILALEEIQDNNGAQNDGTVDSSTTVAKLVAAIRAAGGPAYAARWINPEDGQDGGQPGGNIRSVFLYRPDRDVTFVDRAPGDATTATGVIGTGKKTHLTHSPGRIDPTSAAWEDSRKPLVGEFQFRGQTVFAIANHFASKGGDDPLFGRWQQPERSSEVKRHLQAAEVRGFVDDLLKASPDAKVVVLGDINDFEFSKTADILVGDGPTALTDLPRTLPAAERYTYVYEGNSQVLDHILVSASLTVPPPGAHHPAFEYDVVHTNAEFHDQDSDHDPQIVRLAIRGGRG